MNILLDKKLEELQKKLDLRHKTQSKVARNKSHIAIGIGRKNNDSIGLFEKKQILKKTKNYLRIGKMKGAVE